ncbi:hypothetical protein HNR42_001172 [Deinobacterium chartae]|uniref:Uncharacterized protein n=1 Tax=Deinobacterium chartae TaxID=521158 RepID=A0A841I1A9_9DEIO|nr:hypothetical protein [Deinobacterium chartae]MBB6097755.1 hypothetical protein [Deinobacterium chartae]
MSYALPYLRRLYAAEPALTFTGVAMALLLLAALPLLLLDPRVIAGAPAWLKPVKFLISTSVYGFTLAWLLDHLEVRQWLKRAVGYGVAAILWLEIGIIVLQVLRGTTSHFNTATPFDSALYSTMGIAITLLWLANLGIAVLLLRQRFSDPAWAWSLRAAVLIGALGMAVGFLMTTPMPGQITSAHAPEIVGAHSVGVPDGGAGLPLTGWSTEGGDLRVGHFVGLHALQVLPLVGAWILRRRSSRQARLGLVLSVSGSYLALTLLLTWQALRAQPLLSPDPLTWTALALWALASVAAIWWTSQLRERSALQQPV